MSEVALLEVRVAELQCRGGGWRDGAHGDRVVQRGQAVLGGAGGSRHVEGEAGEGAAGVGH